LNKLRDIAVSKSLVFCPGISAGAAHVFK